MTNKENDHKLSFLKIPKMYLEIKVSRVAHVVLSKQNLNQRETLNIYREPSCILTYFLYTVYKLWLP